MENEMLPCPFCGSPGILVEAPSLGNSDRVVWVAACGNKGDDCAVQFPGAATKRQARVDWNRRTTVTTGANYARVEGASKEWSPVKITLSLDEIEKLGLVGEKDESRANEENLQKRSS